MQLLAACKLEQWSLDRLVGNENAFDNENFNLYVALPPEDLEEKLPIHYYLKKAENMKIYASIPHKILMGNL